MKRAADEKGNSAIKKIAKLFMNSLYGKLGQRLMEKHLYFPFDQVMAGGVDHLNEFKKKS